MNVSQIKDKYTCLDWLGEKVLHRTSNGYLARCPWRADKHPSLCITANGKGWIDQATGEHGNIIDMVKKCLGTNDLSRVCAVFNENAPASFSLTPSIILGKENSFQFFENVPLTTRALYAYLHNRHINIQIARQFLQEAHYSFQERVGEGYLYALSYANDKGGYELRSQIFKGSKSPKGITTHNNVEGAPLVVFEGFFDMLSFATLCGGVKHNYIVLNSIVNVPVAIEVLRSMDVKVLLCLDNDKGGDDATRQMTDALSEAQDIRSRFAPAKDVNEFLIKK